MTTVTVRMYAGLRDLVGAREITMELPVGATVATLRDQLGAEHPAVVPMLPVLVCAVDEEYVSVEHPLRDGDRVALIPPVSGGI